MRSSLFLLSGAPLLKCAPKHFHCMVWRIKNFITVKRSFIFYHRICVLKGISVHLNGGVYFLNTLVKELAKDETNHALNKLVLHYTFSHWISVVYFLSLDTYTEHFLQHSEGSSFREAIHIPWKNEIHRRPLSLAIAKEAFPFPRY